MFSAANVSSENSGFLFFYFLFVFVLVYFLYFLSPNELDKNLSEISALAKKAKNIASSAESLKKSISF
jgi:hypothetical protein